MQMGVPSLKLLAPRHMPHATHTHHPLHPLQHCLQCVPFSRMITSLLEPSSECSASTTGVTITSEREESGVKFS